MLNFEICRKCLLNSKDGFEREDMNRWDKDELIKCPYEYTNSFYLRSIHKSPPNTCPYVLEHIVDNKLDEPKKYLKKESCKDCKVSLYNGEIGFAEMTVGSNWNEYDEFFWNECGVVICPFNFCKESSIYHNFCPEKRKGCNG